MWRSYQEGEDSPQAGKGSTKGEPTAAQGEEGHEEDPTRRRRRLMRKRKALDRMRVWVTHSLQAGLRSYRDLFSAHPALFLFREGFETVRSLPSLELLFE